MDFIGYVSPSRTALRHARNPFLSELPFSHPIPWPAHGLLMLFMLHDPGAGDNHGGGAINGTLSTYPSRRQVLHACRAVGPGMIRPF
eukprot:746988-Hanusia_phi.AAC.3